MTGIARSRADGELRHGKRVRGHLGSDAVAARMRGVGWCEVDLEVSFGGASSDDDEIRFRGKEVNQGNSEQMKVVYLEMQNYYIFLEGREMRGYGAVVRDLCI